MEVDVYQEISVGNGSPLGEEPICTLHYSKGDVEGWEEVFNRVGSGKRRQPNSQRSGWGRVCVEAGKGAVSVGTAPMVSYPPSWTWPTYGGLLGLAPAKSMVRDLSGQGRLSLRQRNKYSLKETSGIAPSFRMQWTPVVQGVCVLTVSSLCFATYASGYLVYVYRQAWTNGMDAVVKC